MRHVGWEDSLPVKVTDFLTYAFVASLVGFTGKQLNDQNLMDLSLQAQLVIAAAILAITWVSRRPIQKSRKAHKPHVRAQRPSDYPPPYPNGWFAVYASFLLKKGEVRAIDACGHQLVLFRNNKGVPAVLDAWCPHLGAHLGEGGTISERNCLRCPFHGWEFDENGKCTYVEGTDIIPPKSDIRAWPTVERNGAILVWFDAAGRDPQWEVPKYPHLNQENTSMTRTWYLAGYTTSYVNTHAREIPENGPDSAHLNVLHKDFVVDAMTRFMGMTHEWTATWQPNKVHPEQSSIYLTQKFNMSGRTLPGTFVPANINQVGPGIVSLQLSTPVGRIHVFEYVLPIAPLQQKILHVEFASLVVPRPLAYFMLWALDSQFHRDQPIWERKRMATRPVVSKADGPLLEYRRWFNQFYSPESLSFPDAIARENMLDW